MPSKCVKIQYKALPRGQEHSIKHLWQRLNSLHHERSVHFKDHFASFTFEKRMEALRKKEAMTLFCAVTDERIIGYCLASTEDGTGEIDSLYIDKDNRKSGVGGRLVQMAVQWLEKERVSKIAVSISHGNEEVLPFYEKHGFRQRLTVMTRELPEHFQPERQQAEIAKRCK